MSTDGLVLDAIYALEGIEAVYVAPDGAETPCRFCFHQPQDARRLDGVTVGGFSMAEKPTQILVRSKEVERPESGGGFQVGQRVWRIGEDQPIEHDAMGDEWRCNTVLERL